MQAAEWTGRVGETWAAEWRRTDRSFAGLDDALEAAILAAVAPGGPARLIDLGCGAGATSLAVMTARPLAEVIGLDLSPELVAIAEQRRREAGIDGGRCRFLVGDSAASIAALAPVDLFFSRHGVMFFDDPVAAFARFAAAAAPGAVLVFSCFAALADNPWATEPAGLPAAPAPGGSPEPGPFAFADPARVSGILAATGWCAFAPERVTYRYVVGAGADPVGDAVGFFQRIGPAARALRSAPVDERTTLLARLADACARRLQDGEVAFPATAWLWSAYKESR